MASTSSSNATDFLAFCEECGVLAFGDFTLKSGRKSPYFFNAGLFKTGKQLASLATFYANAVAKASNQFSHDLIFGPAYKGIPLAAATAIGLATHHGVDTPYAFNRKEAKDHGEGGTIVGAPLAGRRVLVVDDVITAGTAARESAAILAANSATFAGLVIALDRMERGADTELSAVEQVEKDLKVPVVAIATLDDLILFLDQRERKDEAERLRAHQREFGLVASS